MKEYRLLIVAVVLGVTPAFAQYSSPEVMFVLDEGDGTAAHPVQIERYDPYSGAYLGAFGAGYIHAGQGISVIGQDVYVTDLYQPAAYYSRIEKFNFSTGAYDGTVFNGGPNRLVSVSSYGGNLIAADYGTGAAGSGEVWTLGPTGALIGSTTLPSDDAPYSGIVVGSQYWVSTLS